jgi:hypothetical protein
MFLREMGCSERGMIRGMEMKEIWVEKLVLGQAVQKFF